MANVRHALEVDTRKFQQWMKVLVENMIEKEASVALRKIAFDFLRLVISATPVDTGRARAAWTLYYDVVGKGYPKISGPNVTEEAIAQGRMEGDAIEHLAKQGFKINQYVEIINNVPYIIRLEYGHSEKAPDGMVRISIQKLQKKLIREAEGALWKAVKAANRKVGRIE